MKKREKDMKPSRSCKHLQQLRQATKSLKHFIEQRAIKRRESKKRDITQLNA
jgi:hypothetical protein